MIIMGVDYDDPKIPRLYFKISKKTNEDQLKHIFQKFGKIERLNIHRQVPIDRLGEYNKQKLQQFESLGSGHVDFDHWQSVHNAFKQINGQLIDGVNIQLKINKQQDKMTPQQQKEKQLQYQIKCNNYKRLINEIQIQMVQGKISNPPTVEQINNIQNLLFSKEQ